MAGYRHVRLVIVGFHCSEKDKYYSMEQILLLLFVYEVF